MRFPRVVFPLIMLLALGAGTLFAGESAQSFDIPAGRAERTLTRFSRQSSQSAVYPTDLVRGVRTNAVKGEYTPLAALTAMLQGTTLQPVKDDETGALLIKPANARNDYVVELPPYTVEGAQIPVTWQYAALPGVEVLSRCSDSVTKLLLYHHFRLRDTLTALLPEEFQIRLDVPITYVLFDALAQPGSARELTRELEKHRKETGNWIINGMSNYRFGDKDAVALFFVLDELNFTHGRLTLTPDYFHFMMANRTPTLPPWFIGGMVGIYRKAVLESAPPGRSMSQSSIDSPPLPNGVIALKPLEWLSEEETTAIKKDPLRQVELLPLAALFSTPPPGDERAALLWRTEAALFIRWALDGGKQREALWQWVRQSCERPATEAQFIACFGIGFARAEQQLRDYLPVAIKRTTHLSTDTTYEPPVAKIREATVGEISRVKGRLDRMEIAYVREQCPELTPRYITQARQTLHRAYAQGDRDPRLLAEMGLCECDAGNDAAARPLLEAAVAGKVVRPRAYYELARIYYQVVLAKSPKGRLTVAEAGQVLGPVGPALRQSPAISEAYELIAEVWLRSEGRLAPEHLAVLDEGIRNFPTRTRLIYSAAILNSLHGRPAEARVLTDRGLEIVTRPDERDRFLKLKAALATDAAAAATPP
ncbi:MAG: hypothetical protein IPN11_02650 [Opitutaceae bacterium]|nr:hypothetical protein [Opitutaceae bacterium]